MNASASGRRPTPGDVILAVLLGSGAGGGLTAIGFAAMTVVFGDGNGGSGVGPAMFVLMVAAVAAPLSWLAGLLLVGLPCWWVLHRLGVRSRWAGSLLGALLTFFVAGYLPLWASPGEASFSLIPGWSGLTWLGVVGGITGWVVVWTAYPKEAA